MYNIKKINRSNISELKKYWEELECGFEMTYFQTYLWNTMILNYVPQDNNYYEVVFYLIKNEIGDPILIAPLWIIKERFKLVNKRGVYLFGRQGWSDYLNFIYKDFNPESITTLFEEIRNEYHIDQYFFECLKEKTSIYKCIKSNFPLIQDNATTCVKLEIPFSNEEYMNLLSKHSRQNIRTARNRLIKDGHKIEFNFEDYTINLEKCEKMRAVRVNNKNAKQLKNMPIKSKIKHFILEKLIIIFPQYLPFYTDTKKHMISAYIDNELATFFNLGYDIIHKEILVMAVGTNEKFAKYSPGILTMFDYIMKHINEKDITTIDFTRGNESYKYALGGNEHYIHTIKFRYNEKNRMF